MDRKNIMAGLLNIGLSGVNAAQGQLITTSHNIANAGTDGYHRQRVIQSNESPYFSGVGFFGTGTKMTAVTRAYDQFLENQVLSAATRKNEYSTYAAQIRQIDNLLADPSAGLTPALDAFFAGVQEVAVNPTSTAARQSLLSSAQSLITRFHGLDARLSEIREGVEYDIRSTIDQINTYAQSIAELNQRIVVAQAAGAGRPANDLLDQRWQLVTELNNLIQVSTKVQGDGTLSVFIGSGQSLVQSNQATKLAAVQGKNDPQRYDVAIVQPIGNPIVIPERLLAGGGQLAGLLAFRSESLDPAQNRIGMLAVSIAAAFNNQHKLGVDLEGHLGQQFFALPNPSVIPSGAATVTFDFDTVAATDDIANLGLLTDADYELKFNGTIYTVTNLSTRNSKTLSVPLDSFEGLRFDLSSTTLAAGDTALVRPTRAMARDIALAINDPRQIAAGCPVIGDIPTSNVGSGQWSGITMQDVSNLSTQSWPLSLSFSGNTLTASAGFTITPASYDPSTQSAGAQFTVTGAGGFEFTFTLSGTPQNGDVFNLSLTSQGVADNRNANLLGALQTTKLLFSNGAGSATATLGMGYSQLVNKIGNKTHEMQTNEATQATLLAQATETRDALSAVNLDEEAANLIRYQQAYQASGRVMSIAQRLFDEIISIAR
jgi:flagellar hook-associated protein 1 FlgK